MKTIIGIIIIYITLVILSASLMRYIWNAGFKGTEHEETWRSSLIKFGIAYLISGAIIGAFIMVIHFFLN